MHDVPRQFWTGSKLSWPFPTSDDHLQFSHFHGYVCVCVCVCRRFVMIHQGVINREQSCIEPSQCMWPSLSSLSTDLELCDNSRVHSGTECVVAAQSSYYLRNRLSDFNQILTTTSMRNKKLSRRRETARRFVSLNIFVRHSSSLKVIRNDTVE